MALWRQSTQKTLKSLILTNQIQRVDFEKFDFEKGFTAKSGCMGFFSSSVEANWFNAWEHMDEMRKFSQIFGSFHMMPQAFFCLKIRETQDQDAADVKKTADLCVSLAV